MSGPEYTIIIVGTKRPTDIITTYPRARNQIVEMSENSSDLEDFRARAHKLVDEAVTYMLSNPD